jgi:glycosyltransferase involved in cell wall biosynthesis
MSGTDPEVSVCLITYNHEPFIREAIDGVLAQEKPFTWELIIAEDCSTDRTREIVRRYAAADPEHIRLLLPPANTRAMIWVEMMASARGRWVAYLDGDDYWTDPQKLGKQRAFLLAHPDCALVAHPVRVLDQASGRFLANHGPRTGRSTFDLDDLVESGTFFANSAVMYRASALPPGGPDRRVTHVGDWLLHMQAARQGWIGLLPEAMGVNRRSGSSKSAANRRHGVDAVLRDQLYSLERARGFGAHPRAIRRGQARAHFVGALSALEHRDFVVFRREIDASAATGERISPMQGLLIGLRHVPGIARAVMWSYARLRRQR